MRTRDVRCGGISTQSGSGVATNTHVAYTALGTTRLEVPTGQRAIVRMGVAMSPGGNVLTAVLTVNGVERTDCQADTNVMTFCTPELMLGSGVYTLGVSFYATSSAGNLNRGFLNWLVVPG
jgi:hypothetical protein